MIKNVRFYFFCCCGQLQLCSNEGFSPEINKITPSAIWGNDPIYWLPQVAEVPRLTLNEGDVTTQLSPREWGNKWGSKNIHRGTIWTREPRTKKAFGKDWFWYLKLDGEGEKKSIILLVFECRYHCHLSKHRCVLGPYGGIWDSPGEVNLKMQTDSSKPNLTVQLPGNIHSPS